MYKEKYKKEEKNGKEIKENSIYKSKYVRYVLPKNISKQKKLIYLLYVISNFIIERFWYCFYVFFKSQRTFVFENKTYYYFYHPYNHTWKSERAIEIPIVWNIVKRTKGKNILEIGNVLSHYFKVNYDIVDKYEKAKGVINLDVVDFHPNKKYDLIISISTLEHVGWDERPRESYKILKAISNLKNLLSQKGKIVVTLPLGENPEVDELLKQKKLTFNSLYYFKRISKDNLWIQTTWDEIKNAKYNKPFPYANAIIIGIIENKY